MTASWLRETAKKKPAEPEPASPSDAMFVVAVTRGTTGVPLSLTHSSLSTLREARAEAAKCTTNDTAYRDRTHGFAVYMLVLVEGNDAA
jgi:acyl-coenzyme A synthetase/AMP-(fatty) acid ligase